MPDTYQVGKSKAVLVGASTTDQRKIYNAGPGKLYYKTAADVDTEDTEVASGSSYTTEVPIWIISASESKVFDERLTGLTVQDVTVGDDLKVTDDLTVTGDLAVTATSTFTGGVVNSGTFPGAYAGNWHPITAESGTDTAIAEKKLFLTSVWLPANKTLTGIGLLVGSVGGKGKLVAGLFNSSGEVLAKSSEATEGTATGTAKEVQELAFTSTYPAVGPKTYWIGVTGNNSEDKIRTIPSNTAGKNVFAGEVELSEKNKLAKVTVPTTFTGGKGVVGFVY